jgi:hypothetical protein
MANRGDGIDMVGALGLALVLVSADKLPTPSQLGQSTPGSGVRLTLTRCSG